MGVTDKGLVAMVLGLEHSILFKFGGGVGMKAYLPYPLWFHKINITEDVKLNLLVTTNDEWLTEVSWFAFFGSPEILFRNGSFLSPNHQQEVKLPHHSLHILTLWGRLLDVCLWLGLAMLRCPFAVLVSQFGGAGASLSHVCWI